MDLMIYYKFYNFIIKCILYPFQHNKRSVYAAQS